VEVTWNYQMLIGNGWVRQGKRKGHRYKAGGHVLTRKESQVWLLTDGKSHKSRFPLRNAHSAIS
jgi:hypothetical protein